MKLLSTSEGRCSRQGLHYTVNTLIGGVNSPLVYSTRCKVNSASYRLVRISVSGQFPAFFRICSSSQRPQTTRCIKQSTSTAGSLLGSCFIKSFTFPLLCGEKLLNFVFHARFYRIQSFGLQRLYGFIPARQILCVVGLYVTIRVCKS